MSYAVKSELYLHEDLNSFAHHFLHQAKVIVKQRGGSGPQAELAAAVVFTAFSLEAFVNAVGIELLAENWIERSKLKDKLKEIGRTKRFEYPFGQRPFQSVQDLMATRDKLAHGKPTFEDRSVEEKPDQFPLQDWEAILKLPTVTTWLDEASKFKDDLLRRVDLSAHDFNTMTEYYGITDRSA